MLLLLGLLGLAFAGLGYRLVDLQLLRHDELAALAQQNTELQYFREPRRGSILDAHGNLLATSIFVKTVCADPVLIGNQQASVAHTLAPLLQMSEADLYERLLPRARQNEKGETVTNRYVVLRHKVRDETWEEVQAAMSRLSFGPDEAGFSRSQRAFCRNLRAHAIFTSPMDDQLRVYPNGSLAAHALGFVSTDELSVDGQPVLETSGRDGVELSLNSALSGVPGWRVTEMDRRRQELASLRDQDVTPRDGYNVVLTIDGVIQHIVETALTNAMEKHTPISITGIVIRPQTGEILALATLPDFDPNNPGASSADARRDRVISDIMEPGSTFKIVVVSGALNDGVVQLADTIDCDHGHFAYAGRVLHDHEPFDILTTESIITKSSNIGAAKIGIRLGEDRLYDYAWDFGFGQRTGIPLPGEVAGILHPVKDWSKVSIAQIPMGQGVAVTRLQMAMAMCAIANGGKLMQPMLVSRLADRNGNVVAQYAPQVIRQVINPATDKLMVEALKTVVSPQGTAPDAALKDYVVAGKTGTAQKAGPGGYLQGKYFASFIGFFPADNPQLCISVVMDDPKEGYYGGQVCGPIFKEIAERCASYLNLPADENAPEPGSPPPLVAAGGLKPPAARNP
ncbi:MAG TPA: penicillin-binding transpeptidase domain-containing protein [Candidatus Limnocylindrales bacterium]|nr:penicillin-binding transpeptidase domain-containing protein [Candidatus Limnocylindrales bacterium]